VRDEHSEGRRGFLNTLLGAGFVGFLGSILYPVLHFLRPPHVTEPSPSSVVAAKKDELAPNSGKVFPFGNQPAILVRDPEGKYRAFAGTCTHLQCTVQYRPDQAHIWCACHNGHYNLNGEVLSGPPPRALAAYDVAERGDEIVVIKKG
jgi:Rieske Fe-S protein